MKHPEVPEDLGKVTYTIVSSDGSRQQVTEDEFQYAIDKSLAEFNFGLVPMNDEERQQAINRMKEANK